MMRRLSHACNILMEQCASVRRGEEVLIVADDLQAHELNGSLWTAAARFGAHPVLMVYPAIEPYGEPPRTVLHAMKSADVVIACGTRPFASQVMEEALKTGARILSMFRITPDAVARTVPIDYPVLNREMKKIKKILDDSTVIEISSARGTQLRVRMGGRPTRLALGSVRKSGEIDFIPAGAIGVAPLEGTAEGRVAVDGTVLGFGRCPEPILFEFERGKAKALKRGTRWEGLRELLGRDRNAAMLCEIGLGANPKARLTGGPEDERVRGSVHIGLGENRFFGGTLASASHLDGTMLKATLTVDGQDLVRNGKLLV
jgi:leucyl aminopeptidase (aminopeptidase T)